MKISHRAFLPALAILALMTFVAAPSPSAAQQTLYVVDNGTTIYKIAPDGTQTTFASGLGAVTTIALDAAGNVYAGYASASGYGGGIIRFAPDGTQSNFTGYPTIANTTGLAFDASGHLFEAEYGTDSNNNSTLHEVTQGGVVNTFAQVVGSQRNLAFDTAGNLYVADEATNSVTKIAPDATKSTFASGLSNPYGLAFDASGNLFVANYGNGNGTTVTSITPDGTQSTFANGLAGPGGLAFDQNGNLFVANISGATIAEITPAGTVSTFASGFISPSALAFSAPTVPAIITTPDATAAVGTAYFYQVAATNSPTSYSAAGLPAGLSIDTATGLISGTPTAGGAYTVSLFAANTYGTGSGILTLAVSPGAAQQTLYVAESGTTVVEVAPDGTQTQFLTGVGGLGPITLDGAGNLYVGTDVGSGYGGSILRFTPAGTQSNITGYPSIGNPTGLTLDANGNLFEAEAEVDGNNNSTIHKITPDGTVTALATVPYYQGGDAFDSQGNLYVASIGGNSVAKIAPDGTVSTFATGLDEPLGLAIDSSDNIYVANNGNGFGLTISKITPAGVVSTYATGLGAPSGLAFDQYGNLYVTNNATHGGGTITEITPAGAKGTFAAGFTNPAALVFSAAHPSLQLTAASTNVTEAAGSVTLSVSRAGGGTGAISVNYATADDTAFAGTDYQAVSGTLSWADGDATAKTITVPILNRNLTSGSTLFLVNLSTPGGGVTLASPTQEAVTILDVPSSANLQSVTLFSPPAGVTLTVGQPVVLQADVEALSGTLANVEFFAVDSSGISTDLGGTSNARGQANWTPTVAGTYTLQVIATDTSRNTQQATSAVTVVAAAAVIPQASLQPGVDGITVPLNTIVPIVAQAVDSAGNALQNVQFYLDGVAVTSAPVSAIRRADIKAADATAGTLYVANVLASKVQQIMTVVGTTASGVSSVSTAATIYGKAEAGAPPTATISNLASGASVPTNAGQSVSVSATSGSQAIAKVQLVVDNQNVGTATAAPFNFNLPALAAGSHVLSVISTDIAALSSVSAPVTVTAQEATASTPAFFTGETALSNGVYYLAFANGNYFGYYSFLPNPAYIYHFDLGFEYVFDANDGKSGVYFYDFASSTFFYTSPSFPFPYLYDFSLNSVLYYYPDPNNAGHYNTDGIRYFYDFNTGQIITK